MAWKSKRLVLVPATMNQKSLTHADAGVSIDAGNALVKRDRAARHVQPPGSGADAELGGFGGFFDLKAGGYPTPPPSPLTMASEPSSSLPSTPVRHAGVGIDLVAMCVNDLIVQGAEPLFFLDYYATGKLDDEVAAARRHFHCRGLPPGRLRAHRRETAEMPGMYPGGRRYDLAGFCVGAVDRERAA